MDSRDFLCARWHRVDLPLPELLTVGEGSLLVFGWLSSEVFWEHRVRVGGSLLEAWSCFERPVLPGADAARLVDAARTVLLARAHLLTSSLEDLYDAMPGQLLWAHSQLDAVAASVLDDWHASGQYAA